MDNSLVVVNSAKVRAAKYVSLTDPNRLAYVNFIRYSDAGLSKLTQQECDALAIDGKIYVQDILGGTTSDSGWLLHEPKGQPMPMVEIQFVSQYDYWCEHNRSKDARSKE